MSTFDTIIIATIVVLGFLALAFLAHERASGTNTTTIQVVLLGGATLVALIGTIARTHIGV